ncbi:MAG: hypothetical protein P0107_00290 [Nitrosomonas sp.]|nr:hypothetical protein [Nitrosomonas sp.]
MQPWRAKRKAQITKVLGLLANFYRRIYSATEARIGKRRVLMLGTKQLPRISFAPECREAAHQAIDREGTGTTGSRMANGNYYGHRALEREFAGYINIVNVLFLQQVIRLI